MADVRILEVKESVFANNDRKADELRDDLKRRGTFLLNLMSSPGSGKTTTLARTIEALRDELSIAVMEADIDSDVDARTIADTGARAIQLHTGGMCHLDAYMTEQGLDGLLAEGDGAPVDLAILENVGNLVCPVDFDLGENLSIMILSVPEGDDKPLKYPGIFQHAGALLLNKVDVAPAFDFDMDEYNHTLDNLNPQAPRFSVSAVRGQGMDEWCAWLAEQIEAAK